MVHHSVAGLRWPERAGTGRNGRRGARGRGTDLAGRARRPDLMAAVWRLVKTVYQPTAWDGEGARRYGGRWNSPGAAVVYAAEHLSLACLEVLVAVHREGELADFLAIGADL